MDWYYRLVPAQSDETHASGSGMTGSLGMPPVLNIEPVRSALGEDCDIWISKLLLENPEELLVTAPL